MTWRVAVFGMYSDPVGRASFRSRKAAEAWAAEREAETYTNPHNLDRSNRNPDGSLKELHYTVTVWEV